MAAKKSGYRGVSWSTTAGQWKSQIWHDGGPLFLGYFEKEAAAAKRYDGEARALKGAAAHLNFPRKGETKGTGRMPPKAELAKPKAPRKDEVKGSRRPRTKGAAAAAAQEPPRRRDSGDRRGKGKMDVRKQIQELITAEGRGAQAKVVRMSGVNQPSLCQWLQGKFSSPSLEQAMEKLLAELAASGKGLGAPSARAARAQKRPSASKPARATRTISKDRRGSRVAATTASAAAAAAAAPAAGGVTAQQGWTSAEDTKLRKLVQRYGAVAWATKAKQLGGNRSENAVRSRWHMYLRPDGATAASTKLGPPRAVARASTATRKATSAPAGAVGGAHRSSRTYSRLPQASFFAEDGEEELTAAVAVVIEPSAAASAASGNSLSLKRGSSGDTSGRATVSASPAPPPPLARDWHKLPKETKKMLLNHPEAVEPTGPAEAADGVCAFVQRSDSAPLPPFPPPPRPAPCQCTTTATATTAGQEDRGSNEDAGAGAAAAGNADADADEAEDSRSDPESDSESVSGDSDSGDATASRTSVSSSIDSLDHSIDSLDHTAVAEQRKRLLSDYGRHPFNSSPDRQARAELWEAIKSEGWTRRPCCLGTDGRTASRGFDYFPPGVTPENGFRSTATLTKGHSRPDPKGKRAYFMSLNGVARHLRESNWHGWQATAGVVAAAAAAAGDGPPRKKQRATRRKPSGRAASRT